MLISATFSILALVISALSLWLSYTSTRKAHAIQATERRSEIHGMLVESRLKVLELRWTIMISLNSTSQLNIPPPPRIEEIYALLGELESLIIERMTDLESVRPNDVLVFEELKLKIFKIKSQINQTSLFIKDFIANSSKA